MEISWAGLRKTPRGYAVADLIVSVDGVAVKYCVYLRGSIRLVFQSADRSRAELAAQLLRRINVGTEVRKVGNVWCVQAYTDVLAAGRKELRRALAEVVKEAAKRGWVSGKRAEKWLKKLERGRILREGWPKYEVRLSGGGALIVKFGSTNPDSIMRETRRLRDMGLEEGKHFSAEMPGEGRDGYVYIRREGLVYIAWLSVYGAEGRRELAAEFVEYILRRAEEAGKEVYERAAKTIEEGRARSSLTLEGFMKEVEVGGRRYVVKAMSGGAGLEESRSGRLLLRVKVVVEVNGVERKYEIVFGRYGRKKEVAGYAVAGADAPGGREADAERLAAVVEALTGRKPRIYRKKNGAVVVVCGRQHLEGFRRFKELAEAIERWLSRLNLF